MRVTLVCLCGCLFALISGMSGATGYGPMCVYLNHVCFEMTRGVCVGVGKFLPFMA